MAQSRSRKQLFNMAYGLGAAVVILGALFKINHIEWGFLTGSVLLAFGLGVEALIFAISAFEPVDDDVDWTIVYPELAGKKAKKKEDPQHPEGLLSKKLDELLRDAKIDAELIGTLGDSIRNLGTTAKNIAPATDAVHATKRYGEELSQAATQMEALNSLYKIQIEAASQQAEHEALSVGAAKKYGEELSKAAHQMGALNNYYESQLETVSKQTDLNKEMAANTDKLKEQMESLTANLSSLNGVYGGMLSAMNRN